MSVPQALYMYMYHENFLHYNTITHVHVLYVHMYILVHEGKYIMVTYAWNPSSAQYMGGEAQLCFPYYYVCNYSQQCVVLEPVHYKCGQKLH